MKAYKCDRCGKLYELTSEQTAMRNRGVNYGVYSLNGYCLNLCEICEKCFYELQDWVMAPKTYKLESDEEEEC